MGKVKTFRFDSNDADERAMAEALLGKARKETLTRAEATKTSCRLCLAPDVRVKPVANGGHQYTCKLCLHRWWVAGPDS